jgi:hypothetical protein
MGSSLARMGHPAWVLRSEITHPSFARMGHPVGVAGVTCQITPETMDAMLNDPDEATAEQVMNAMMGMVKLDIGGAGAGERRESLIASIGPTNRFNVIVAVPTAVCYDFPACS